MSWYFKVLKNYAVFRGRASRKEYWMFVLVNAIIWGVLAVISAIIFGASSRGHTIGFPLAHIYGLAVLIPSLAVSWRRLHDRNRSGWWILIGLIPVVGAIILLVFYIQDSQPGENRYGPNLKGVTA